MEAQTLELIELFEETILIEGTDPEWSGLAELALDEASKREEMTEFNLVDAKCGTTMCRMELSLDGSESPEESFRKLVDLAPWQGEGFIRIQDGNDEESAQTIFAPSQLGCPGTSVVAASTISLNRSSFKRIPTTDSPSTTGSQSIL